MKLVPLALMAALFTTSIGGPTATAQAADGASSARSSAKHKGADGMPGCDGGTDPSPDGKFYLPGTSKECNPGPQDRKKVHRT